MTDQELVLDLLQRHQISTQQRTLFSGDQTIQVYDGDLTGFVRAQKIEFVFKADGSLKSLGAWT